MLKASFFSRATDTVPELRTFTSLHDLARSLLPFRVVGPAQEDKRRTPAVSPAEFLPEARRRTKDNVVAVNFLMLDFDGSSHDGMTWEEMRSVLSEADGIESFMYTTHGHAEAQKRGLWKFRLGLSLSRGVLPSEWPRFIRSVRKKFLWLSDAKCEDPCHIYFTPSVPDEGSLSGTAFELAAGEPFGVDAFLSDLGAEDASGPPAAILKRIGPTDLADLADRLSKSRKSEMARRVAKCIKRALAGEPYADKGERDEMQFQAAGFVCRQWPDADPSSIYELFRSSIDASVKDDPEAPDFSNFCRKVDRQLEAAKEEQRKKAKEDEDGRADLIRAAFLGKRSTPYTEQELDGFAKDAGCSREEFRKRWILSLGDHQWIFRDGQYQSPPVRSEALWLKAEVELAAAWTAGVELRSVGSDGTPRRLTADELLERHGMAIKGVELDLAAPRNRFDPARGILVEAPCPPRPLDPEFSEPVDTWLRHMGGDQAGKLLDWVACVTRLSEPCCALYMSGPPGCGKSLLVDGLARLWTDRGPTEMGAISGSFNEELLRCPLVFADEVLPDPLLRTDGTGWIREFIQARNRSVAIKYRPRVSLRGCVRVVFAANHDSMLRSRGLLTPRDAEAFASRIAHVQVSGEGRLALELLKLEAPEVLAGFVRGDAIARHALWLAANRPIVPGKRFLVEGGSSSMERAVLTSSEVSGSVMEWCVSFLAQPKVNLSHREGLARVDNGRLLVNVRALSRHWDDYVKGGGRFSTGYLAKALSSVSEAAPVRMPDASGAPVDYCEVKRDVLLEWAARTGFMTVEQAEAALSLDTPVDGRAAREPGMDSDAQQEAPF